MAVQVVELIRDYKHGVFYFQVPHLFSSTTICLSLLVHLSNSLLLLQALVCSHSVSLCELSNAVKLASVTSHTHKGPLIGQR